METITTTYNTNKTFLPYFKKLMRAYVVFTRRQASAKSFNFDLITFKDYFRKPNVLYL